MTPFDKKRKWPTISHEEIVHRARILVIDDGDFPYKVLFERDGYTIKQWTDVDNLKDLETGEYDLILLDLIGVGRKESADQGFGVLKHIRRTAPAQIVVAYSNDDLSLTYQPFFNDADAVLAKTTDYVVFKQTVDDLLDRRFSLGFFLDRVNAELGEHAANAPKATKKARAAILTGKTEPLRKYLTKRVDDKQTIDRVLILVNVAAKVFTIWNS